MAATPPTRITIATGVYFVLLNGLIIVLRFSIVIDDIAPGGKLKNAHQILERNSGVILVSLNLK